MNNTNSNMVLINHPKNWMKYQAVNQLKALASLPEVIQAVTENTHPEIYGKNTHDMEYSDDHKGR